jgi:serine/threonine protein kinase
VCPKCRSIFMSAPRVCGIDGTSLIEQSMDPLAGELIDRYRIVENIGRGGVGCVYRGVDGDRQAAIKVLYGDFACDTRFQERFRREAQSISRIVHPNVVALEGFGSTPDGLMFLIMELVNGRTLEDVIASEAPLAPYRAAQIVRQIAAGLGAAHALGFVHRDMKPGNVMLTEDDIEQVKILDFGVVNLLESKTDPRLTATGHIVGTPVYIAPEQIHTPDVGPSADLYALGVLLYEMLTGAPPFAGRTFAELMLKHIAEVPKKAPPNSGLEDIAAALLEKSPEKRPASTHEVIQMIDRLRITVEIMPRAALARPEQTVRTQAPVAIDKPDDEPFEDPASSQFGTVTVRRTLDGPAPDRPTPRDLSPLPFAIATPLRVLAEDALTQIAVLSPEPVDPFDEPADRTRRDVLDREDTTPPPRVTVRASAPPELDEDDDDDRIDDDRALYHEIMGMRAKAGSDRADTNRGATVAVAPPAVSLAKRLARAVHDPRVLTAVGALTFLIAGAIALSILTR